MTTSRSRTFLSLVFASLLFVLALSALGAMVADIVSFRGLLQERFWTRGEPIDGLKQWSRTVSQAKLASKLAPGNPDYLFFQGRLASWRLFVDDQEDVSEDLVQGYFSFHEALAARPYWSEGWSELAFFKAQIGEVDEEFEFAVYMSRFTGPYEQRSILNILKANFGAWEQLNTEMKQDSIRLFDLALALDYENKMAKRAVDAAKELNLFSDLCSDESLSELSKAMCGMHGYSAL